MNLKFKDNQMEEVYGIRNDYPYILHTLNIYSSPIPWHWHDEFEFNYVKQGRHFVQTINKIYEFHAGEAYFINSNRLVSMYATEDCLIESHLFHPVFLIGHFKSIYETKYINPVIHNKNITILEIKGKNAYEKNILALLHKASNLQYEKDVEFKTRNIFSDVWINLLEMIHVTQNNFTSGSDILNERLILMISYIHSHYHEKITLSNIAKSASISDRECIRTFQNGVHMSPISFLLKYRIQTSQKLLTQTDLSISEIAQACGFSNTAYYCKMFKESISTTPNIYRKEHKKSSCK